MTAAQVEEITRLSTRFVETDDSHYWLSCQIGRWIAVRTKVSPYRSVSEHVFQLISFGESWEIAYKMFNKRLAPR